MDTLRIDPVFAPHLPEPVARVIDASHDSTFVLDEQLTVRAHNAAYARFGRENGCNRVESDFGLGCRLSVVLPAATARLYLPLYLRALESGERVEHDYECSSPQLYRRFHQTVYPLAACRGVIVTNHLVQERPHAWRATNASPHHFDADGWLSQCACCRKVRDRSAPEKWDWVPTLVESPHPRTSHTYCLNCLNFYYGELLHGVPDAQ